MMKIFEPEALFEKTSFQEDTDLLESPKIAYPCDDGQVVTLTMKDFKENAIDSKSKLKETDQSAIDDHVKTLDRKDFNAFLDFYCPSKTSAIRIYYKAWAGGRFTMGYDIKFIVKKMV